MGRVCGNGNRQSESNRRNKNRGKRQSKPPSRLNNVSYETSSIEEHANVLFKPNPGPQTEFLAASEREVLYGGSAGGGKSYAMLADPLRYMGHPQFSGLLFAIQLKNCENLFLNRKSCTQKSGPGLSGQKERCSGPRHLAQGCGCPT